MGVQALSKPITPGLLVYNLGIQRSQAQKQLIWVVENGFSNITNTLKKIAEDITTAGKVFSPQELELADTSKARQGEVLCVVVGVYLDPTSYVDQAKDNNLKPRGRTINPDYITWWELVVVATPKYHVEHCRSRPSQDDDGDDGDEGLSRQDGNPTKHRCPYCSRPPFSRSRYWRTTFAQSTRPRRAPTITTRI